MSRTTLEHRANLRSPDPISYEQFLATDFENPHVEWVKGTVVVMAPITDQHQFVSKFILVLLETFVDENKLGVVHYEPFQMKTGPDLPGRSPDILFVSNAQKKRLRKTFVDGPADLVVEIVSPESRHRDRKEKFHEYEKGGVREYWLIDPEKKQAEFYLLDKDDNYQLAHIDTGGIFHSGVLKGLWIEISWFWQTPLPSKISIMRKWGLI